MLEIDRRLAVRDREDMWESMEKPHMAGVVNALGYVCAKAAIARMRAGVEACNPNLSEAERAELDASCTSLELEAAKRFGPDTRVPIAETIEEAKKSQYEARPYYYRLRTFGGMLEKGDRLMRRFAEETGADLEEYGIDAEPVELVMPLKIHPWFIAWQERRMWMLYKLAEYAERDGIEAALERDVVRSAFRDTSSITSMIDALDNGHEDLSSWILSSFDATVPLVDNITAMVGTVSRDMKWGSANFLRANLAEMCRKGPCDNVLAPFVTALQIERVGRLFNIPSN